jgi:hypothetical protein
LGFFDITLRISPLLTLLLEEEAVLPTNHAQQASNDQV